MYSTDLNDNTADLKILFRMTNLAGQGGRDAIPTFAESNFEITTSPVPEPATLLMVGTGLIGGLAGFRRKVKRRAMKGVTS